MSAATVQQQHQDQLLHSSVLSYLTLFAVCEAVNLVYVFLLFPRDSVPTALQTLGTALDDHAGWRPLAVLSVARSNVEHTLWTLYALSAIWDSLYLWTGIRGAARLDRKLLTAHMAQTLVTVPIMLLRARCVDPIANGVLAGFRTAAACLLYGTVMPLARQGAGVAPDDKVQRDGVHSHTGEGAGRLVSHRGGGVSSKLAVETGGEHHQEIEEEDEHHQEIEEEDEDHEGYQSPKHSPWGTGLGEEVVELNDPVEGEEGGEVVYHDLKVLFEYQTQDDRMLSLREGETVRVVAEQDGWFFALDCDGNEGFVPPSYLEPIDVTEGVDTE